MASLAPTHAGYGGDQAFFTRMAAVLAALIVFGFAQFSLRGMVDWRAMPMIVHVHGVAMLAWLAVFVAQNVLAERGDLARHRALGRAAAVLVAVIVVLGCGVGITALQANIVPPFFTSAYFLMLTLTEAVMFGVVVGLGIRARRDTQLHRRLMIGATVVITEPALGRLLPMPLLGPWGGALELLLQLAILGWLVRHDLRSLGRVHGGTLASIVAVVATHAIVQLGARSDYVAGVAGSLAGA